MCNRFFNWINRKIKSGNEEPCLPLPNNLEVFYLATLFILYDQNMNKLKADNFRILDAMEHKLGSGAWRPTATLDSNPNDYYLQKEWEAWALTIDRNFDWFTVKADYLKQLIEKRINDYEADAISKNSERTMYSHHNSYSYYTKRHWGVIQRRVIVGVARGFVDSISITQTGKFNPSNHEELIGPACRVSIEFQGKQWVFSIHEGEVSEITGMSYLLPKIDGERVTIPPNARVKENHVAMMATIAIHESDKWKNALACDYLEQQEHIKQAAVSLGKLSGESYEKHLRDVHFFIFKGLLNEAVITEVNFIKYGLGWPESQKVSTICAEALEANALTN